MRFDSSIELRHLRYFVTAAEHGSFRKAGVALSVQPSAISRRIRDLEDWLGAALFQRHNGGVRLTVAGEKFIGRAREIIQAVADSVADISVVGCGGDGRVRIGLVAPIASGFAADLLSAFSSDHAGVHIELVDGAESEHVVALRRFDLDIAFLARDRERCGCDETTLWSERIFVLMPEWHTLSDHVEIAWTDLTKETFIIAANALGNELRLLLASRLVELGHSPMLQTQNVDCEKLLPLVALGRGIVLRTESMGGVSFPGIVARPVKGETIPFKAVWFPDNDNPALRRFLSMAKSRLAK